MKPILALSVFLVLSVLLARPATADAMLLYDAVLAPGEVVTGASIHVEPSLGRAWLEVTIADTFPAAESPTRETTRRVRVPGLRYDRAAGRVTYADARGVHVVGSVTHRDRFVELVPTARVVVRNEPARVDDGFEIVSARRGVVALDFGRG